MIKGLIGFFLVSPLCGQESTAPAIVGEIRTFVGDTQPKSRVLLNRTIESSEVIHDQGRTITIYQVEAPAPGVKTTPKKEDVVIQFWERKPLEETPATESK
mgnify:CR=1 FL=1